MKEYTISEVLSFTETLEKTLIENLSKSSKKTPFLYKRFLSRCNSLFIIFSQFDLQTTAFAMLHKAFCIDLKTNLNPQIIQKNWKSRILLYINTGFFMLLVNDPTSSLKFLYDAETLIMERQPDQSLTKDLILAHSLVSSYSFFKNKNYDFAERHLGIITREFNEIIRGERTSRYSITACCNIYCLTTLLLDILKAKNSSLASSTDCKTVVKKMKKNRISSVILLQEFIEEPTFEKGLKILSSNRFRKIFAATALFPFIDRFTPIVYFSQLKDAQEHANDGRLVKTQLASYFKKNYKGTEFKDFYALLMMESLNKSFKVTN